RGSRARTARPLGCSDHPVAKDFGARAATDRRGQAEQALGGAAGRRGADRRHLTTNKQTPADAPDKGSAMGGLFANRWLVVCTSILGSRASSGPIMIFSFGVFLIPVTQDLGVSRGTLSSALGPAGLLIAIASLIVGWGIDRWGTRRLMIPGVLLFA